MSLPRAAFYFVRHGETEWNQAWRAMGQLDVPLADAGRQQALAAATLLATAGIERIVYSPLRRAAQTAELIAGQLARPGGVACQPCPGLLQCDWGPLQGHSRGDDSWHRAWVAGVEQPGVESYADFSARTLASLQAVLAQPGRCLIVAHGATAGVIQHSLQLAESNAGHCEPWLFEPLAGGWRQRRLGRD